MSEWVSREDVITSLYEWSDHSITDQESWHLRQVAGDIKSRPGIELKGRPIDAQPIIDRIKKAIEFAEKYNLRSDGTEELRSVLNDLEAAPLIGREAGE